MLDQFSKEHDITSLPESERFEHFSAYITVQRLYTETFDTSDIVTDNGDTGIDAIAIIVNGSLVTDVESFEEQAEKTPYLDVMFIFVQAKRSPSFDASKIGTFVFGVQDFFNPNPVLPRGPAVANAANIMAAIYKRSPKFRRGNPSCRLYYVTTGKWVGDAHLEARRQTAVTDLTALQIFQDVKFDCIGADVIQNLYRLSKNAIAKDFLFIDRTVVPEISGVKEAYLGFIPASEFLSIITEDDGDIIHNIFYDNVRDWQEYNSVNSEIRTTITSDYNSRFVLMNNGITIIARTLQATGNKFHIEDFQVVNGCQTSHVLFDQKEHLTASVMVPLKLISTQDETVINSIIKATNRQTELKKEQFFAITEFSKSLEQFFQTYPEAVRLYYERRSRQYDRLSIEKTRVITVANMIRSFATMFLNEPHRTTRNFSGLLEKVGTDIFKDGHKLEPYYTAAFALYKLEYLFRNQRIGAEYKPARFQILLAARLLANPKPQPAINSREIEDYCKVITDVLYDPDQTDAIFFKAAEIVKNVANGDLNRDNIRTQPITEGILNFCMDNRASDGKRL
jgi:hypothetical protein